MATKHLKWCGIEYSHIHQLNSLEHLILKLEEDEEEFLAKSEAKNSAPIRIKIFRNPYLSLKHSTEIYTYIHLVHSKIINF